MKFKKIMAASLALAMSASLLTACGSKSGGEVDYDEIMSREDVENYVYPEQIELRIPVYDRGNTGQADVTNNYWTKYVQSEFGDKHNIKVTFVSIPRNEEITAFNQLLAGKVENQTDIIFNYDYPSIVSFADQGAFQTLDEEMIKKYAPTYYEATKDLDEYTYVNGEKLFLCATRPKAYNYITMIRKDWLDELGLDIPTTGDEYLAVLKAFRDNKMGGENTIPQTKSLSNAYYANYAYRPYPMPEEENALYSDITVVSLTYEPTKKQLEYDNMLYNEGLVSPEWYLDTDGSQCQEDFIAGRAGIYGCYLTKNPDVIGQLVANNPDAEVAFLPATPGENGVCSGREDNPFGMVSGINANCEHPEAVLMYFEWLSDPDNLYVMQNGIEGVTYNLDDGVPVIIDDYTGEERLNYNSNKDMWCLVIEGKDFGDDETNLKAQMKTYAPEGYEYLIQDSYDDYQKNKEYYYNDYIFTKTVTSLSTLSETLKSKWQVIQTDLTNCSPDEFEAKYEAACEEYLAAGYQEVLDEKQELYNEQSASQN